MVRFAQWVLSQAAAVDIVIDIRTPMVAEMKHRQSKASKEALLPDGIHYNLDGYRIVASKIWAAWNLTPAKPEDGPSDELFHIVGRRQRLMHSAWLTYVGHERRGINAGLPLDKAKAQADKIFEGFAQESMSQGNL